MCGRPQFRICFTAMDYLEEARKSPVRSQPKKGFYLCSPSFLGLQAVKIQFSVKSFDRNE